MKDDVQVDVGDEVREDLGEGEVVVEDDALVFESDEDLEVVDGVVLELEAEKLLEMLHFELVGRGEVLSGESRDAGLVRVDAENEIDGVRLFLLGSANRGCRSHRAPTRGAAAAPRPAPAPADSRRCLLGAGGGWRRGASALALLKAAIIRSS